MYAYRGLFAALCVAVGGAALAAGVTIPAVKASGQRAITLDDMMAVRYVDTLSVSPDGRHFAMFVRQAEPSGNAYRTGWFVGSAQGSELIALGEGGDIGPQVMFTGHMPGRIAGQESLWSPDGRWIAHKVQRDGEVQLWRSRADGSAQEQLTRNAADVREFAWSVDGRTLYFSVGTPRAEKLASERRQSEQGYRYDEDLWMFSDLLAPQLIRAVEPDSSVWAVDVETRSERVGGEAERAALASAQSRKLATLVVPNPVSVGASTCAAAECTGTIKGVWQREGGKRVVFWRGEGLNDTENAFYSWTPASGKVTAITRLRDEDLRLCSLVSGDRLACVRENASTPSQVVAIDLQRARLSVIADVNPEMRTIRLGRVERFEWETPRFAWNEPGGELAGLYPRRAYGYILYPPDFDPAKKYPVFIDPYVATGFQPLGAEHPLHVYAASGMIVLRTSFPFYDARPAPDGRRVGMKQLYSQALDFPHLSMLMESTQRGLDTAIARGFIDASRVGIGGVSHGTFVPLYMMQKHDRIAAISISSPSWGPMQYYWGTGKARDTLAAMGQDPNDDWVQSPETQAGRELWRRLDIAENVETLEAPVLMHFAAQETYGMVRLIRNMADAGKPYDAYVFPSETHIKWQPAHLRAIAGRNLDWFRFWLQGFEDPDAAKSGQYVRWRAMKDEAGGARRH